MPDYKEMYLSVFRATEKAIRLLTEAQMKAEELLLESVEAEQLQENERED